MLWGEAARPMVEGPLLRNDLAVTEQGDGQDSESVSRFHIAPILDQDSGEISCEVANQFGRDSKTFLLSIEGLLFTKAVNDKAKQNLQLFTYFGKTYF